MKAPMNNISNKDRPSTWKPYRPGDCENCTSGCCTMPVEVSLDDLRRLELVTEDEAAGSMKKLVKRLSKEGFISSYRQGTGLFTLVQKNEKGDCLFLNAVRKCDVYERRPEVCRKFPAIGPRPGFCPRQKRKF